MAQEQIRMPSSSAGVTRYFDDYKSKLTIRPGVVVVACLAVLLIILSLHAYGRGLLGL
jgi:preprotein translocase subunit Sec61beta